MNDVDIVALPKLSYHADTVETVQFSASQIEDCEPFAHVAVEPSLDLKAKLEHIPHA